MCASGRLHASAQTSRAKSGLPIAKSGSLASAGALGGRDFGAQLHYGAAGPLGEDFIATGLTAVDLRQDGASLGVKPLHLDKGVAELFNQGNEAWFKWRHTFILSQAGLLAIRKVRDFFDEFGMIDKRVAISLERKD